MIYTPNGYIVPSNFGVHFLPCMKNVPSRTKTHLNKIDLTNTEFCTSQIQLLISEPAIPWEFSYFSTFSNTGVRVNETARLYILCKCDCTIHGVKS